MRESGVRMLDYDVDAGVIVVSFPFDQALNSQLKSELPGMRWDRDGRRWTLPARHAQRASQILAALGFTATRSFQATFPEGMQPAKEPATSLPRDAQSVGELVARINRALSDAFPGPVWVVGTLLGLDKVAARAARFYPFNLAEWDENQDKPVCQLDAVMWPNVYQTLAHKFRAAGVELRDTLPVLLKVSVRMWDAAGKLQLYVEDADPSYTVGKILKNLDALHDRLIAEGLAERNRSLPWPELPLRIGVITAAKDGFSDFQKILSLSGFPFVIHFVECRVQGPETVPSVVAALARLARESVDCIALMRGGGANADLSWFNDYAIGRAVCLCPIPVIVGIGHDRDETLPDRLARSRSTPTAVAETLAKQILAAWTDRAARSGAAMERVKGGLVAAHGRLRNAGQRLELRVLGRIARQRERLGVARTRLAGLPQRLATTQLPLRGQRLRGAAARSLERAGHVLEIRWRDLAARDPIKLLARGYARLATTGGRIVRRAADLAPGQDVRLRMADGTAVARIQEVTIRPDSKETAP